ncbi:PREDICTED: transmembrane protein 35-like, partial [Rhagoletis zephyria]|uniref:transmembrane protein 35-like n=1 Tax=Rhagoletis zephyria TaxID=28612 RepID=UPI0008115116
MTKIAAIVLSSLSIFLGMFFFFIGYIKLSPSLNRDIHREIRRSFVRYAKVVPLFKQMGWKVSPGIYRKVIGFTEIIAGLLLAFMPDVYKFYVSLFLMCITLGAVYTHIMVDDDIG